MVTDGKTLDNISLAKFPNHMSKLHANDCLVMGVALRQLGMAVFMLAFSLPTLALNLGPFHIGMSNAQVSRIGMTQCRQNNWSIECRAVLRVLDVPRDVTLTFDRASKALVEVSLNVKGPSWSEKTAQNILAELQVNSCGAGDEQSTMFGIACFAYPDQIRQLSWHTNRYWVSVRGRDGAAVAWFKQQRSNLVRKRQERDFELGK